MKVLVVGFAKTGTKSMTAALTELGYNVYDYEATFHYLAKDWIRILTEGGKKDDFYRMYKDVDASCDTPANIFWEDILEAFPDTKLIFMQRDSQEEWVSSIQNQIKLLETNYAMKTLSWFSPTARALYNFTNHMSLVGLCGQMTGKFYATPAKISPSVMKMRYRNHNAAVLMRAPKDQLLVFKLSDGWKPLCEFLEKPVPETPFPHENKQGEIIEKSFSVSPAIQRMKVEMKIYLVVYIAAFAVVISGISNFLG